MIQAYHKLACEFNMTAVLLGFVLVLIIGQPNEQSDWFSSGYTYGKNNGWKANVKIPIATQKQTHYERQLNWRIWHCWI